MIQNSSTPGAVIAKELKVSLPQVQAAIALLEEGASVPFIARYRKEATKGLDDQQLRYLAERLVYLSELEDRRKTVLTSIQEQGKLNPELQALIDQADTKTRLEDLYLPFRPKRRSKAQSAIEAGLEPLALALWQDPSLNPQAEAKKYLNELILNEESALEGASQILMERFAEEANLLHELREYLWSHAILQSQANTKNKGEHTKYKDYFNYEEPIKKIPSHRALAIFRARREGAIGLKLLLPPKDAAYGPEQIAAYFKLDKQHTWLFESITHCWKSKIFNKLELELLARLREAADEEGIKVFAANLKDLLLAAPAGPRTTLGLDPGIRTGVKAVVIDASGAVLDYATVFPFAPQNEWHASIADLAKLITKYKVELISIGNGTASRETDRLVTELLMMYSDLKLIKTTVSEAGASVYSASELASKEFPDLDVTLRGAVSIARRLQDPLAELVKIEPKSIGVGQYQHDVNQARLSRCLNAVVEDCVNAVGVDLNTASAALLTHISGLNEALAKNIIEYRSSHGPFKNREALKEVARMGEKTFQQAAGFLRIMNAECLLDASSVHPEAYPLVEQISAKEGIEISELIANKERLARIKAEDYVSDRYGLLTIKDVLSELEKPGRDPRPEFKTPQFKEGIHELNQLEEGMILEGVVSNVTNFGAFVDIGVHQDGLVHISAMKAAFISDPRSVVKAGDIVQVKIIELDKKRKRIGLSMKLNEAKAAPKAAAKPKPQKTKPAMQNQAKKPKESSPAPSKKGAVFNTAMADALAQLKKGKTIHD